MTIWVQADELEKVFKFIQSKIKPQPELDFIFQGPGIKPEFTVLF